MSRFGLAVRPWTYQYIGPWFLLRVSIPSLISLMVSVDVKHHVYLLTYFFRVRVQELCESRGGRPGLSVLTSRMVSGPWT